MIETTSITVGIPVGDLDDATAWYGRLLEAEPDIKPVEGILESEVRDGFWLQLFEAEGGSGEAVVRFGVREIEAATGRLREVGIEVGEVERVEGVIAFCDFADPWGNVLSLYQILSGSV